MPPNGIRRGIGLAAALILGVTLGWLLPRQPASPPPTGVSSSAVSVATTTSLMLDYGDGRVVTYAGLPVTAGQTVWELLQELVPRGVKVRAKDYGGNLGMLVTGFGEMQNDARAGKFWHYWVNQRFATVGVSSLKISPGDQILWKYTSDQFQAETK